MDLCILLQYGKTYYSRRVLCPWVVYYDVNYKTINDYANARVETRGSKKEKEI